MPKFTPEELTQTVEEIFMAAKSPREEAQWVAQSLVRANLLGLDSHGLIRVPAYIKQVQKGESVEKEHTNDEAIARGIALDHLTELPDYYSRLSKMEEQGKRSLGEEAAVKAATFQGR